jgi:hypothetical protein
VEEEKRVECRMAVDKTGAFDEDIPEKKAAKELADRDIHTTQQKTVLDVERDEGVERDLATTERR